MRAALGMLLLLGCTPAIRTDRGPVKNVAPIGFVEPGPRCDRGSEACFPDVTTLDGGPLDEATLAGRVVLAMTWAAWDMPGVRTFATACDLARTSLGVVLVALLIDEAAADDGPAVRAAIGCDAILVPASQVTRFGELTSLPFVRAYGPRGHERAAAHGLQYEPALRALVARARQPEPR